MSSFTYLSKAAIVLAAAAIATGEVVGHIRRLSSSDEEEQEDDNPYRSEMIKWRFPMLAALLVALVIGILIIVAFTRCVYRNPSEYLLYFNSTTPNDQQPAASSQPDPGRMSIEPALNFTNGLTLAGGADHAECTVCLSEFTEGEEIRILSNCGHGFHPKCIEAWLLTRSSCPTCRTSCVTTSVKNNNPPENQHDLEAANPPAIELMVLQHHP